MTLKSPKPARFVALLVLAAAACTGDVSSAAPLPLDAGAADAAARDSEPCPQASLDAAVPSPVHDAEPPAEPSLDSGVPPSTACEAREASDAVPSVLRGTLGAISGASTEALELSCGSIAVPDLLFAFTAPEQGHYEFSAKSAEVFDTVLAVFDGACDGEELGCSDDDGGELTSRLALELSAGQHVIIAVESWIDESGEVEVEITAGAGSTPVDAESCLPTALPASLPATVTGDASGHLDQLTPSCAVYGSSGDALYVFTAEQAGTYRFDTRGSDADTLLQLLEGDCTGEELACNDDSELGGLAAIAELDLSEGQTVLVNVDSLDGTGSYSLTVDRVDPTIEPLPASE